MEDNATQHPDPTFPTSKASHALFARVSMHPPSPLSETFFLITSAEVANFPLPSKCKQRSITKTQLNSWLS